MEEVTFPADFSEQDIALCRAVAPFTMTSPERICALRDAVRHVVKNDIPGDVVECGVWRGGSMMVVAKTLRELEAERPLHLFDTFEGMTPPTSHDRAMTGASAQELLGRTKPRKGNNVWCIADEADVRANLEATGYRQDLVRLVRGRVEDTIPTQAPQRIALLRLDTDWYESTRHELAHLYPRLSSGGVLLIDDYGYWEGARRAVDEFLEALTHRPLLQRIDTTGRLLLKP